MAGPSLSSWGLTNSWSPQRAQDWGAAQLLPSATDEVLLRTRPPWSSEGRAGKHPHVHAPCILLPALGCCKADLAPSVIRLSRAPWQPLLTLSRSCRESEELRRGFPGRGLRWQETQTHPGTEACTPPRCPLGWLLPGGGLRHWGTQRVSSLLKRLSGLREACSRGVKAPLAPRLLEKGQQPGGSGTACGMQPAGAPLGPCALGGRAGSEVFVS